MRVVLGMNPFGTFKRWDLVLMCISLAAAFGMEMLGVFGRDFVTITAICRSFVPRWIRFLVCLWLMWHMVAIGWLTNKSWPALVAELYNKIVL